MRFIQSWSYACANFLSFQMKENHEKRRVYYFGSQVVIASMVKGILLLAAALITRTLIPTLAVMAAFMAIRVIAGGYHMDTYGKCAFMSISIFIAAGCIVEYTHSLWTLQMVMVFIVVCFLLGLFSILKWAPSDTPNRPITNPKERKKFKLLSLIYLAVWMVVESFLTYKSYYMFSLAGCFGLMIEAFIITPLAAGIFDRISRRIDNIK